MKFPALLTACTILLAAACGPAEQKKDATNNPPTSTPPPTTPSTITVSGTLVDSAGQPVSGIPVVVADLAPINTDSTGHFSFAGVKPPYDLTVIDANTKSAVVYKGLTRADPKVLHLGAGDGLVHGAVLNGYAAKTTTSPDTDLIVSFVSPEIEGTAVRADSSGWYQLDSSDLWWKGPAATSGTLLALELAWNSAGDMPADFKGLAASPVTLQDGGSFTKPIGTVAVTNRSVSGVISAAPNYAVAYRTLGLMVDGRRALWFQEPANAGGFNFVTPGAAGIQIQVGAVAARTEGGIVAGFKSGLATDASSVSLTLPAPPESILPASGALGVDGTMRFSWSPMANAVHIVTFAPVTATAPSFYVVTTSTDATIPDLAKHGLAVPSQANYRWQVSAVSPFASVDEATLDGLAATRHPEIKPEYFKGSSAVRTFVTR